MSWQVLPTLENHFRITTICGSSKYIISSTHTGNTVKWEIPGKVLSMDPCRGGNNRRSCPRFRQYWHYRWYLWLKNREKHVLINPSSLKGCRQQLMAESVSIETVCPWVKRSSDQSSTWSRTTSREQRLRQFRVSTERDVDDVNRGETGQCLLMDSDAQSPFESVRSTLARFSQWSHSWPNSIIPKSKGQHGRPSET